MLSIELTYDVNDARLGFSARAAISVTCEGDSWVA